MEFRGPEREPDRREVFQIFFFDRVSNQIAIASEELSARTWRQATLHSILVELALHLRNDDVQFTRSNRTSSENDSGIF